MPKGKGKGKASKASGRTKHDDAALTTKVLALRGKDKKWSEIADQLGITSGKAQFLAMVSAVKPKDRIKFTDDEDLAAKVVTARDSGLLSWGQIAARSGVSEGKIKRLYEEAGGTGIANVASARKGDAEPAKPKGKKGKGKAAKASAKGKVARKGKGRRKGKGAKNPSTVS